MTGTIKLSQCVAASAVTVVSLTQCARHRIQEYHTKPKLLRWLLFSDADVAAVSARALMVPVPTFFLDFRRECCNTLLQSSTGRPRLDLKPTFNRASNGKRRVTVMLEFIRPTLKPSCHPPMATTGSHNF